MILGKITAAFILLILIIYNAINSRFQPFLLLTVFCVSILTSFVVMLLRARKIQLFYKNKRYIYEIADKAKVEIIARNVSSIPFTNTVLKLVAVKDGEGYEDEICFVSEEEADSIVTLSLMGNHCGVWTVSCLQAYYLDLFKVFKKRIVLPGQCTVVIMPDCNYPIEQHMGKLQMLFKDTEITTEEKGNDNSEIIDIRDYRPGDKLNSIHWKVSSKRDRLSVKEFGSEAVKRRRVYFDCKSPFSAETRDDAMNVLYSVSSWMVNCGQSFELVSQDESRNATMTLIENKAQLVEEIINILNRPFYYDSQSVRKMYEEDLKNVLVDCIYITEDGIGGV